VLAAAPPEQVEAVLAGCRTIEYPDERVLLSPGDVNDSLFLVLAGGLRVHPGGLDSPDHLYIGPGDCAGEFSLIDRAPVSAHVVAEAGTRLLVVDSARFWDGLLPLPGVAAGFLKLLTRRARQTMRAMVGRLEDQLALERFEKELRLAREIQASMVPVNHSLFPDRDDVDGFAAMQPALQVGGDFLDAFLVGERRLFLAVGDVAGKGIAAALFMARTMGLLRLEAGRGTSLPRMLARVNQRLCQGNTSNIFVTVTCASLDLPTGELTYVNGGHPALLHLGIDGASHLKRPPGSMLGIIEGQSFPAEHVTLARRDRIVAYTDGVTEAIDPDGEMFGVARLLEAATRLAPQAPQRLVEGLLDEVLAIASGRPPSDDVAVLALAWNGPRA
jgi:serine phosphatase RsbU (regulator of sigma subunit)